MPSTPFTIENFGGLNLIDDPLEVGFKGAVDLKNVWFESGRIETCPGLLTGASCTRTARRIYDHAGANLLASESDGTNVTLQAFDTAGTSVATTTYASANTNPHGCATIGTPTASRSYLVRTGDTTRRWDGSAWSTVAGIPSGNCAAPASFGTRLAVGYASGNPHRVAFSTITGTPPVADPETFGANDYVDLSPGDGQTICQMVSWRGDLYVFKQTKFFVFYGESVDATGNPIFNYRMVDAGYGVGPTGQTYPGGACAGKDAVYFLARDGVYATVGGPPVCISNAIAPIWPDREPPSSTLTSIPNITAYSLNDLSWARGALYLSAAAYVPTTKKVTFVFRDGKWTYLDIQENATSVSPGNFLDLNGSVWFVPANSTNIKILRIFDGPSAATWSYKSGRYALAEPGRVAVVPETSIVGTGTVALRLDSDLYSNQNASATLGGSPTPAEGWPQAVDQEGTWLQYTLSGSTAATVSRLNHFVSYVKPGGVR